MTLQPKEHSVEGDRVGGGGRHTPWRLKLSLSTQPHIQPRPAKYNSSKYILFRNVATATTTTSLPRKTNQPCPTDRNNARGTHQSGPPTPLLSRLQSPSAALPETVLHAAPRAAGEFDTGFSSVLPTTVSHTPNAQFGGCPTDSSSTTVNVAAQTVSMAARPEKASGAQRERGNGSLASSRLGAGDITLGAAAIVSNIYLVHILPLAHHRTATNASTWDTSTSILTRKVIALASVESVQQQPLPHNYKL